MRSFGIINISFVLLVLCYNKAYEHTLPRVLERDPNTGAKLGAGQGERERESTLSPARFAGASARRVKKCQHQLTVFFRLLKSREPLQILWRFFSLKICGN